jgi:hypothetical protein
MMMQLMVAGIGLILIGLGAIGYGIPVKEFGFGNTLILAGAIAACTGVVVLALHAAVRELASALNGREQASAPPSFAALKRPAVPAADEPVPADQTDGDDLPFTRDRTAPRVLAFPTELGSESAPPWQQDAARERERQRAAVPAFEPPSPPVVEPPPARPTVSEAASTPESGRGRRSLLFSSSRRERERAALAAGASTAEAEAASDPRRNAFDEAWPEPARARGEPSPRLRPDPVAPDQPEADAPPAGAAEKPEPAVAPAPEPSAEVTLLKSGEVDGMAYSLYSDGSIEARMPEGMMRFASIDELRSYLDQRS